MLLWVIYIILALCAISLIVLVVLQKNSGGLGSAFGGGGENYFGKNKSKTKEARLSLLTKIDAGVIAVLSVVLVLMMR